MKVLNFSVGSIIKSVLKMLLAQSISTLPLKLATKSTCNSYKNKTAYQHNGLTGSQRYLILHPDEAQRGIVVYNSTLITFIRAFPTIAGGKPTRGLTDKLVSWNKITHFKLALTDSSLRVLIDLIMFNVGRVLSTPCQQTRLTERNFARRGRCKCCFNYQGMTLVAAEE
jgi:hypothetical protein